MTEAEKQKRFPDTNLTRTLQEKAEQLVWQAAFQGLQLDGEMRMLIIQHHPKTDLLKKGLLRIKDLIESAQNQEETR